MKKVAAILLASAVIASSAAIFAGVGPAVNLLASFEKEYETQKFETESQLLDLAETLKETVANAERAKE